MSLGSADAMERAAALTHAGDFASAEVALRELLQAQPNHPAALNALSVLVLRRNQPQEAVTLLEQALRLRPNAPLLQCNLANALRRLGRAEEALVHAERAATARPDEPQALAALASVRIALRQFASAREIVTRLLPLAPDNPDAWLAKASLDLEDHDAPSAIEAAERALANAPDNIAASVLLARALLANGQAERALEAQQQAIARTPESWEAHFTLGQILRDIGRFEEAQQAFRSCLALEPDRLVAWVSLTEVKRFRDNDDADLSSMQNAAHGTHAPAEALNLDFALAKAYDDLRRYAEAADHMLRANAAKRAETAYDEQSALGFFARLKRAFSAQTITRLSGGGTASALPIFVFGMPRSGTTLVEQIIASHPDVAGGGELEDLDIVLSTVRSQRGAPYPECLQDLHADTLARAGDDFVRRLARMSPGARRITDKAPSSYFHVGLVHLALPGAKMIHVRRDPVDTCLSCFSKLFGHGQDHCYDLAELGRYYRAYDNLMRHWRSVLPAGAFLDVQYEDVVADTENQARRILQFCGLDWTPAVLDFHKDQRAVNTWSAQQVRQPIYDSSVQRWRNYEDMLQPLLKELGDLVQG